MVCTCPHVWFLWSLKVLYRLCIAVIYLYIYISITVFWSYWSLFMCNAWESISWLLKKKMRIVDSPGPFTKTAHTICCHPLVISHLWGIGLPLGDLTMNSKFQLNRLKKKHVLWKGLKMAEVDHENGHFLRFSLVNPPFSKHRLRIMKLPWRRQKT